MTSEYDPRGDEAVSIKQKVTVNGRRSRRHGCEDKHPRATRLPRGPCPAPTEGRSLGSAKETCRPRGDEVMNVVNQSRTELQRGRNSTKGAAWRVPRPLLKLSRIPHQWFVFDAVRLG